ncbi:SMI1/KNR4 family protein [Chryseobacterium sp. EO14]|uniref:SMI1/KNR4 family protein n=1 Tax=Chryseobacterium sp. EO14 TaxID=2950551 RepID=UPI00210BA06C|nr:SMI1/KNR4 family protein [Chryseobacterium sp. EO14]MCQ4140495.1 SMI1/KNR4 family protein [Chryseobacterium sp. EO14]
MTIELLKKLEQNKKIGSEIIQGVSEVEINKVETKFDIKFPRAYREYLSLAGKYAGNLQY